MCPKQFLALVVATAAFAQPVPPSKEARIALRYSSTQILIVGGEYHTPDQTAAKSLEAIVSRYPPLPRTTGEIPLVTAVPPHLLTSFQVDPRTAWRIGEQWQFFPGAGLPAIVTIEKVVMLGSGCDDFRDGAIARFVTPTDANRVAGLRATEFLVAPVGRLSDVSQMPLIPTDLDQSPEIRKILLKRAQAIVKDENWEIAEMRRDSDDYQRARELNRRFLSSTDDALRIQVQRWEPPGRKPLLFVIALWVPDSTDKEAAVFAAEAILEEANPLKLLSFEYHEAQRMRMGEFASWSWTFDNMDAFLNAYKIGNRYFILRRQVGYESGGVALQEFDSKTGVVETGLWYALGC